LSGVGPGQFADAYWADAKKEGKHVASLGTHNSYTQVGAEGGLPVFFCYAGVIILCIRSNYRLYRGAMDDPKLRDIMQMSFCLFLATIGLATNAIFHHMAYSMHVPVLGGLSICLQLIAKPYLQRG
jgi:O-antigen ligase